MRGCECDLSNNETQVKLSRHLQHSGPGGLWIHPRSRRKGEVVRMGVDICMDQDRLGRKFIYDVPTCCAPGERAEIRRLEQLELSRSAMEHGQEMWTSWEVFDVELAREPSSKQMTVSKLLEMEGQLLRAEPGIKG